MAQQNIYDDEIFFEGYKKIRDNKINANNFSINTYIVFNVARFKEQKNIRLGMWIWRTL